MAFLVFLSFIVLFLFVSKNEEYGGWLLWLDKDADWKNESPETSLESLEKIKPSCGWGNLFKNYSFDASEVFRNPKLSLCVSLPSTVEEHFWDEVSVDKKGAETSGDYKGVSWWGKEFFIPKDAENNIIKLKFLGGVRQRAEIFVNEIFVKCQLAHQIPFDVDISEHVNFGEKNKVAIRITDPNGNFSWGDFMHEHWGKYLWTASHGFGGILGEVNVEILPKLHVGDIFIKNKPSLFGVDADIEVENKGEDFAVLNVSFEISENFLNSKKVEHPRTVFRKDLGSFDFSPMSPLKIHASAFLPDVMLWDIGKGNLYDFSVVLRDAKNNVVHQKKQRFGFRFLDVENDEICGKHITLNGRRIFLISAISWGFYPQNGIYPSDEIALLHVKRARELGLNMLNFHRNVGNEKVFNAADEIGLLLCEESGGYLSTRPRMRQFFSQPYVYSLPRERFLESVRLHRNHPSLAFYNMANEPFINPDSHIVEDLNDARKLDPTRLITYGSGFMEIGVRSQKKLHALPYGEVSDIGYCSRHNSSSSAGVYVDGIWNSPNSFLRGEKTDEELLFWGEEGAIASPPQLELICAQIGDNPNGWDGADYKRRLAAYKKYIKDKGLSKNFPSITNLITSMGNVMYYEHGRILENARIADSADAYIFNGWEDMKRDNFSGAVDAYRNLKGDLRLISKFAEPLFVAVKVRDKVAEVGDAVAADFFVINENVLERGEYVVKVNLVFPDGKKSLLFEDFVKISGGKIFCDKVRENVIAELNGGEGYYYLEAELFGKNGVALAAGRDEIFAVDLKNPKISDKIAVAGDCGVFEFFAKKHLGKIFPKLENFSPKTDVIILGKAPRSGEFEVIPALDFSRKDGKAGLEMEMFKGKNFEEGLGGKQILTSIDFNLRTSFPPDSDKTGRENFSMRVEGFISSDEDFNAEFQITHDDGVRVWMDGNLVANSWREGAGRHERFSSVMRKGERRKIKIEAFQARGGWQLSMSWKKPNSSRNVDLDEILRRVKEDGTILLVLEDARLWIEKLRSKKAFPDGKIFTANQNWIGHNLFVKEHDFFEGLPANCAMNWEYQCLATYGRGKHWGLYEMEGEEPIVSLVGYPLDGIATSMGAVKYGKGKIVFSSLDIPQNLIRGDGQSSVAKKIFLNMLKAN